MGTVAIVVAGVIAWQIVHLALVVAWSDRRTRGAADYARSPQSRRRYRRVLRMHGLLLSPILAVLGLVRRRQFGQKAVHYAGIAGPAGACSPESFRRATEYVPRAEDVFVVTQMRSGT